MLFYGNGFNYQLSWGHSKINRRRANEETELIHKGAARRWRPQRAQRPGGVRTTTPGLTSGTPGPATPDPIWTKVQVPAAPLLSQLPVDASGKAADAGWSNRLGPAPTQETRTEYEKKPRCHAGDTLAPPGQRRRQEAVTGMSRLSHPGSLSPPRGLLSAGNPACCSPAARE